jgi:hypothetical protein
VNEQNVGDGCRLRFDYFRLLQSFFGEKFVADEFKFFYRKNVFLADVGVIIGRIKDAVITHLCNGKWKIFNCESKMANRES